MKVYMLIFYNTAVVRRLCRGKIKRVQIFSSVYSITIHLSSKHILSPVGHVTSPYDITGKLIILMSNQPIRHSCSYTVYRATVYWSPTLSCINEIKSAFLEHCELKMIPSSLPPHQKRLFSDKTVQKYYQCLHYNYF